MEAAALISDLDASALVSARVSRYETAVLNDVPGILRCPPSPLLTSSLCDVYLDYCGYTSPPCSLMSAATHRTVTSRPPPLAATLSTTDPGIL